MLNHATAVLRGLIYQMVVQQRPLISHLREKYDHAGRKLFEDQNALYFLSKVFIDMLQDLSLAKVYLIVDALDECGSGLSQLLDLILQTSSMTSPQIKWLVSSRYRREIEQRLGCDQARPMISLELNADSISNAVNAYIRHKVSELARESQYDSALQAEVRDQLYQKANGTFLWVALVCKELRDVEKWDIPQVLTELPSDLEALYARMIEQIRQLKRGNTKLCFQVLSIATLAFRPLSLQEVAALADLPDQFSRDPQSLSRLVDMCGLFFTIQGETVYFIHQSAKDYLSNTASTDMFPLGQAVEHCGIVSRSLQVMSRTLRRDIWDLRVPGASLDQIDRPDPDPLACVQYACCYWVHHLCEVEYHLYDKGGFCEGGKVLGFLQKHFLHWLEALGLMGSVSSGVVMISKLKNWLRVNFSAPSCYVAYYQLIQ